MLTEFRVEPVVVPLRESRGEAVHAVAVTGQAVTAEVQFCLTGMQEHLVGETAIQVGADPHAVGQLLMQAAVTARVDVERAKS